METSYVIRLATVHQCQRRAQEIAIYAHDHAIAKPVEDYNIVKNARK